MICRIRIVVLGIFLKDSFGWFSKLVEGIRVRRLFFLLGKEEMVVIDFRVQFKLVWIFKIISNRFYRCLFLKELVLVYLVFNLDDFGVGFQEVENLVGMKVIWFSEIVELVYIVGGGVRMVGGREGKREEVLQWGQEFFKFFSQISRLLIIDF